MNKLIKSLISGICQKLFTVSFYSSLFSCHLVFIFMKVSIQLPQDWIKMVDKNKIIKMIGVKIEAELKRQALEPNPRHEGLEMILILLWYILSSSLFLNHSRSSFDEAIQRITEGNWTETAFNGNLSIKLSSTFKVDK